MMTYSDLLTMNRLIDLITLQLHRVCLLRLQINHAVNKTTHTLAFFRDSLFSLVLLAEIIDLDTSKSTCEVFAGVGWL